MVSRTTSTRLLAGAGALALAGWFMVAPVAAAQEPSPASRAGWQREHRRFMRGPFGELGLGLRRLDVTDAQREQIHGIMQQHRDELQAAGRKAAEARQALENAMRISPIDEAAIRTAAQGVGDTTGEMALLRARIRTEVLEVLTPEQREKAQALRQQAQERRKLRQQQRQQLHKP